MAYFHTCPWAFFCITWTVMLVTLLIMNQQARHFYTLDVVLRKFSIFQLEFPASPQELSILIKGIYALPPDTCKRSLRALKGQLYTDFFYMFGVYGSIHVLCHELAMHAGGVAFTVFIFLSLGQFLAWACDIVENIYLLQKINNKGAASSPGVHRAYQVLEIVKWGLALTGATLAISTLSYDWLTGQYQLASLPALGVVVLLTMAYAIAAVLLNRRKITVPQVAGN
ncbi:MAG TPA: hypothetical protein VGC22_05525 [Chitinophaga sp.]